MNTTIKMKRTPIGKNYWNHEGAYERETEKLYDDLVPAMGEAETINGELIRISHRLYHEYCNNGNMNARDERLVNNRYSWYDDDEEDEYDIILSERYAEMIEYLRDTIRNDELNGLLERIEEIILNEENSFCNADMHTYDTMIDIVTHYVLTHENKAKG